MVRILIPFLVGILLAIYFPSTTPILLRVFILFFVLFLFFIVTKQHIHVYQSAWVFGILINGSLLLAGYDVTISKTELFFPKHISSASPGSSYVYARVAAPVIERGKSVKAIVEVISLTQHTHTMPVVGKVIVYFQKDRRSLELNYGDEVLFYGKFQKISEAKNVGEFDYRKFMSYKNVYNQVYVGNVNWVYTGENAGNILIRYSLRLRNKLLRVLKNATSTRDEFAVAAALMIGDTDKLESTIREKYSQTGVMHVLAVSGLHVGIVFAVFNWFLFFLNSVRYGAILKTILLLLFLWSYAVLTGCSPSVLRAATMFSFILFSKQLNRSAAIYNTLATSILFLLLFNPYMIMEVGFQLSYIAVAGIFIIEPLLSKIIRSNNRILNKIGSLINVSIAAQLATLPISLYCFHQFPSFFLIANLLILPLSTSIIYTGIFLLATSNNSFLFKLLSPIFSRMVSAMNSSVDVIQKFPHAVLGDIFITLPQVIVMYAAIVFSILFIHKKQAVFLKSLLVSIIVFLAIQCQRVL